MKLSAWILPPKSPSRCVFVSIGLFVKWFFVCLLNILMSHIDGNFCSANALVVLFSLDRNILYFLKKFDVNSDESPAHSRAWHFQSFSSNISVRIWICRQTSNQKKYQPSKISVLTAYVSFLLRICNMQEKLFLQYSVQWGHISFLSQCKTANSFYSKTNDSRRLRTTAFSSSRFGVRVSVVSNTFTIYP